MPDPEGLEVTIFATSPAELLMQREAQIAPSRRENNALGHRMSLFWHRAPELEPVTG
jgi:hypothetical protein